MHEITPQSHAFLGDCMDGMAAYPDGYFDLAIVDPPYGIGATKRMGMRKGDKRGKWIGGEWDNKPPDKEYFTELFRVSKNQIIWGGNYFELPGTRCCLIWDKVQRIDQADCEIAWTSFNGSCRIFQYHNAKQIGFMNPDRFHPTEKPIALYSWILDNYAKPGDKIIDTHLGSQSSRIAAYKKGFDFWGWEIDADYYREGCERFEKSIAMPLFENIEQPQQTKLFDPCNTL